MPVFLSSTDLLDLNCKQAQTVWRPFYLTTDCQTPTRQVSEKTRAQKTGRWRSASLPDLTNKQPLKWHLKQPQTTTNTLDDDPSNTTFRTRAFPGSPPLKLRSWRLDNTLLISQQFPIKRCHKILGVAFTEQIQPIKLLGTNKLIRHLIDFFLWEFEWSWLGGGTVHTSCSSNRRITS